MEETTITRDQQTSQKNLEQALRESEAKFRTLIENMQEGVMIVDNNDVVKFVNPRICEMLAYREDEILGRVGYKLLFKEADQKIIREKNRLRTKKVADRYEIQMRKKSGKLIWVQISGVPIVDSERMVSGSFGIITDITQRRQAEQELKEAHDELEKRVQERTAELVKSNESLQREINERKQAEKAIQKYMALRKNAQKELQKAKDELELRVEERTAELSKANKILRQQILERQRAEEQLKESEKKYRMLFNSGNDAAFVYHLLNNGEVSNLIEVNDVACEKLGYSREELLKMPLESIIYAQSEESVRRNERLVRENYILYEDTFLTKAGLQIPVEISALLFSFNEKPTIISVARDITARKRAQDQIHEQAALLDKAQDAILVCDLSDYIIYWNKSAERLYGWKTEEVIGNNAFELLFKNSTTKYMESRRAVLDHGEWQGELPQVTKEGKQIVVESRWTLVHDNDGRAKSILVVNTDITEKKKIESQFLRAQRMESIGALAGGIAHDLNNVLAPILTAVQILEVRFSDEKSLRLLQTIESNVKRGADMVKQILTFARGVEGERIPLKISYLIHELEKIALETFPKSIQINLGIPRNLRKVSGDATQLHQVLLNLCVNARDAMPNGGNLTLSAENVHLDEKFARIHLDAKVGHYVVLKVTDTGVGIPGHLIDKIFEPFFTTKESDKGTGLGLSTVMAIVGSHGGFVNVNSEVGKGTTFEIYLPALVDIETEETEFKDMGLLTGKGEVILVADDEISIREITRETLETYGYSVMVARDGAEAVGIYAEHKEAIEAVITDMMMPVMDGAATILALQKIDPKVKIIASSGFMEDAKIAEIVGKGVDAFLHKPYTAERLLEVLHRTVHKHRHREQSPEE